MTLERKIANVFNLTSENWMKHSNPWSVWTRYSVLPIIVIAFWSRLWIGWWCLIPGYCRYFGCFLTPYSSQLQNLQEIGLLGLSWVKGYF